MAEGFRAQGPPELETSCLGHLEARPGGFRRLCVPAELQKRQGLKGVRTVHQIGGVGLLRNSTARPKSPRIMHKAPKPPRAKPRMTDSSSPARARARLRSGSAP